MTFVDAISLIKNKPAAQLEANELAALRAFIETNPSFYAVAGGQEAVERYLAEAQTALDSAAVSASSTVSTDAQAPAPPVEPGADSRKSLALAAVLLLALFAGALWWFTIGRQRLADVVRPNDPTARQDTQVQPSAAPSPGDTSSEDEKPQVPDAPIQPSSATEAPQAKADVAVPAELLEEIWEGWLLRHAKSVRIDHHTKWDLTDPSNQRPLNLLFVTGGQAELVSEVNVDRELWLRIALAEVSKESRGQIEVRIDGQPIARFPVRKADNFAVPLAAWRGKKVRLSVTYLPDKPEESIVWDSVRLVTHSSGVAWIPLTPERLESSGGAKFTVRPDDSIVVEGNSTEADEYLIVATLPQINIQAVKLEALSDAALPAGGPGRASDGTFCVAQFGASLTAQDEQRDQVTGRYVRVELPGPDRPLMMAEVEVFSGGKNVALEKPTAQSSAERRSFGERAVDGNRDGRYDHYRPTTVMHTRAGLPDAWWEVDLGQEYPIERITLWNRTDRSSEIMANHRVVVLDMYRKLAWQTINPYAPLPSMVYGPFVTSKMPLEFRTAASRTRTMLLDQPRLVRPVSDAAATPAALNEQCNFVFPLERNDNAQGKANFAGRQVSFRIRHRNAPPAEVKEGKPPTGNQNLGRFRLLVTADPTATTAEPPVELVSLLPGAPQVASSKPQTPPPVAAPSPAPAEKRDPNTLLTNFAWEGWIIQPAKGLNTPHYVWDVKFTESPKLESRLTTAPRTSLVQARQIDAAGAWLKVRGGQATPSTPVGQIEVRVDGKAIARFEATPFDVAPERLISLQDFVGRNVKLELAHVAGSDTEAIEWDNFGFVASPEAVGYIPWQQLTPLSATGGLDATFKILPDNSVLSGGDNPPGDVYRVTARLPKEKITAVRLEVLPDPSLPMNGPGRGDRGNWNVGKFTTEVIDESRPKQTHTGRFVRLELVGPNRSLHLAELQVFSGGKNVALKKPASQCSEMFGGIAARAVDGLSDFAGHGGAVGFAHTSDAPLTWWEVDLQQDFPIEKICIWNRQWDGVNMANNKIIILDKDRKEVWSFVNPDYPVPCETYEFPYAPVRPRFTAGDVSFDFRGATAPDPLKIVYLNTQDGVASWHSGDNPGRMQVATFTLDPKEDLSGKLLAFNIGQFRPLYYNVGRFRFSVTTAPGPHKARLPIEIVPKLAQ